MDRYWVQYKYVKIFTNLSGDIEEGWVIDSEFVTTHCLESWFNEMNEICPHEILQVVKL